MASQKLIIIVLENISSPKRSSDRSKASHSHFPYYAGYSESFAEDILRKFCNEQSVIFDPWNGSGTTTTLASRLNIRSLGADLNPVMVIVAIARVADQQDLRDAFKTWAHIMSKIDQNKGSSSYDDPVGMWYSDAASYSIRTAISILCDFKDSSFESMKSKVSTLEPHKALLIIAIIRATKLRLKSMRGSNPTWTKHHEGRRSSLPLSIFDSLVKSELDKFKAALVEKTGIRPSIECCDSRELKIESRSIDFILSSPPYCTRIDYAVSTLYELTALGLSSEIIKTHLRPHLLGTTAINNDYSTVNKSWGSECLALLKFVGEHASHGSKTYYQKNLRQYFGALRESISEMSRVIKIGGKAAIVLQSSYYKEKKIDLPSIFAQMAAIDGLELIDQTEFPAKQTMARINTKSSIYRNQEVVGEHLLLLERNSVCI